MYTLFDIHIELVVGPTVWARFEVCHPDQWNVPASKNFALLVIVEIYRDMMEGLGFAGQQQPISREAANKLIATHPRRAKLDHWLELYNRYDGTTFAAEAAQAVVEVELTKEENNPKKEEGGPDPKATLVFTVADAEIIAHVVGGFKFGSAMCDCTYW